MANEESKSQGMTIERAREIWRAPPLTASRKNNRVLHSNEKDRITLAGNFTADQLQAMAVLMRAGEI
jgi:hypothetical protein